MKPAYRVIVCGPGIIGTALLREIMKKPELELVGVYAYSPEKNGKDIGEYLGIAPIGVSMTTDQEKLINMDADCVLFSPRGGAGTGIDSQTTNFVCRLLESGKNVITPISYWHPSYISQALEDKLQKACEKGGASLHGTGESPGLLYERIVTTLTGASTSISHIKVQEVLDLNDASKQMLTQLGFGLPVGEPLPAAEGCKVPYGQAFATTCDLMGVKLEGVEGEYKNLIARRDINSAPVPVKKGTRSGVDWSYHAIVNGRRFLTLQELWYLDGDDLPDGLLPGDYYTIVVEGEPVSVKCKIEFLASAEKNLRFREGDRTSPGWYVTAMSMIQTIPVVCGAKPGIVYPHNFANFVADLRDFKSPLIIR